MAAGNKKGKRSVRRGRMSANGRAWWGGTRASKTAPKRYIPPTKGKKQ